VLTDEERAQLEAWERRRSSAQARALRSRIVLAAAEGPNNTEIARALGVAVSSVRRWRNRFAEHRLEGLTDEPRPGQRRKITDAQAEEVIVKTLETTPRNATHWSTRSMAAEVGLNQSAVHRIWKAFGLQPHRQDACKLSKRPTVHRHGPRRRRALPQPARARGRALRGREVADPGAGPDIARSP
jgi:transposase